jgi:hypothetical protein
VALTDTRVRNLKPTDNPYKISDGGGLFLLVTTEGSRLCGPAKSERALRPGV